METWKTFLDTHKDRAEYDVHADCIQRIISTTDSASTSYLHLMDHPSLVCITRSSIGGEIQATFFHTTRKTSLLSSEHMNLALLGFGSRACVVRIEPKEMFKVWANKKIPSFEEIMKCKDLTDITNLKTNDETKDNMLEAQAVLPPILAETLYDLDSFRADNVLLRFILKIRSLKQSSRDQAPLDPVPRDTPDIAQGNDTLNDISNTEDSYEYLDDADLANMRMDSPREDSTSAALTVPNESTVTQTQTDGTFDTAEGSFEAKFGRVLEFLWGMIHEDKTVKPTKIVPCGSPAVMNWADTIHDKCLGQPQLPPLPPFHPPTPGPNYPDTSGLSNVATAMTKLSHEMAKKNELEMVSKQANEKEKSEKSFKNLSNVQKHIFILITATEFSTDEDIDQMQPTEHVRILLNQKIGIKAQAQLQHLFKETNHICDISLSMCTQLKNGTIASHPSINDLNGISPLFLPEFSTEEQVTQELALRLEEQMTLGKISDEDLKTITKCRFHFPKNFGEYLHSIKNFHRLVEILSGPQSILTQKIETLIIHAKKHERSYKEIEHDFWYFYASILQYIHRRTQHYVHSASHGLVSKLRVGKLSFSDLLEDIEDGDYAPIQPKWLKQNKRSTPPPGIGNQYNQLGTGHPSGGGAGTGTGGRIKKKVKETIDNEKVSPDLKCPSNLAYREVFHPANRRGVTEVPHSDGSIRCNNWFHRGWCTKDCTLKASHAKTLSDTEREKCKDYLQKLIEKQKRWAGNRRNGPAANHQG